MGRPAASKQNKQFGVFFANVVTVPVESRNTTVARSGEGAIFYVFAQCFPELVRTSSRCGLTQLEFNKYLQNNDFPLIRKRIRRKTCLSPRKKLAFFPPSSFRFAGRRWRNPDNAEDFAYLRAAWPVVTKGLNAIPFEGFVEFVRQAILLDEQSELEGDLMSACSTPLADKKVPIDYDSEDEDESDGEEAAEAEDTPACRPIAQVLDLRIQVGHNQPCLEPQTSSNLSTEVMDPETCKADLQRRRVSEKWIDAQTFLEQFKADLPATFGMDISEILAMVSRSSEPQRHGSVVSAE
jgi:hypothetical protein